MVRVILVARDTFHQGCFTEALATKEEPKKRKRKDRTGLEVVSARRSFVPSSEEQVRILESSFGCRRFAYNWGLAEWERRRQSGEKTGFEPLRNQLNAVKGEEFPWMYEVPKDVVAEGLRDLVTSFKNYFDSLSGKRKGKKMGHPRRKKRGRCRFSFRLPGDRVKITESYEKDGRTFVSAVSLSTIGDIRLDEPLELLGRVTQVSVSRSGGKYYVSFSMEYTPKVRQRRVKRPKAVGVDLNVSKSMVLSNGKVIMGPKALEQLSWRLKREQRRLSKMKKGSKNRKKQAIKVAAIHARIACIRKDFVEKSTTYLLRKFDYVCLEDLNVSGMMRNRRLARVLSDAAMGSFAPTLELKKRRFGKEVLYVDPFFPSSKQCRKCKVKNQDLKLSDRVFSCVNPDCGHQEDRDLNAAINIRSECIQNLPRAAGEFTPMEIWSIPSISLKEMRRQTKVGSGKDKSKDSPASNTIEPSDSVQTRKPAHQAAKALMPVIRFE